MIVTTGAGGFIGGHLVKRLLAGGHQVRAVDVKPFDEWWQTDEHADNRRLDCSRLEDALEAVAGCDLVINLAAEMGGIGFIEGHRAECMLTVLTDTNMLRATQRVAPNATFFLASSACIYPGYRQDETDIPGLREEDAYPADPEDGYGWQKLFAERLCRHFTEDYGIDTRIARYHNVYGPHGSWQGGREKSPAAMCRKVAEAVIEGRDWIEIWGDGKQTRSYMYVDDCVEGTLRLIGSEHSDPINIGSDHMVTVDELAETVEEIAGVQGLEHRYIPGPLGVRGRNSDNTRIRDVLRWEPSTTLRDGLAATYTWVYEQVEKRHANR